MQKNFYLTSSNMTKKFLKFVKKSSQKDRFLQVIRDIDDDTLDWYDIRPMRWMKWLFRIRIGQVRFVFEKTDEGNVIKEINNRWDIY